MAPQIECLNVLKAFMNNQFGLDMVVRTPAAIDALALLFDSNNDRLRIQVPINRLSDTIECVIEEKRYLSHVIPSYVHM